MTPNESQVLSELKLRLDQLDRKIANSHQEAKGELGLLREQVAAFEKRAVAPAAPPVIAAASAPSGTAPDASEVSVVAETSSSVPVIASKRISESLNEALPTALARVQRQRTEKAAATAAPLVSAEPPPANPAPEPAPTRSFEMRLGTFWFVRIGVVMLLTGLVFFGHYAYQNYIWRLGPWGKIGLLYSASAVLLAAGVWVPRRRTPLKNYGEVLFAGGLAAVYFTTYAAHFFPKLRVIGNPLLAVLLLSGWAGFIAWIADRRKSEVLALFAVGLAYYASVVSQIRTFTLFSNLVLTAVAVAFLIRNKWAKVSLLSLFATYAAYWFWRFHGNGGAVFHSLENGDVWRGAVFLFGYWVLFTAATFLSEAEQWPEQGRATFSTINNAAYFGLAFFSLAPAWHSLFCLIDGALLLALVPAAIVRFPNDPLIRKGCLAQGLAVFTLGLVLHFSGTQLAVLLGMESVVLLVFGGWFNSRVLANGAAAAGLLALADELFHIVTKSPAGAGFIFGSAVVGLLMALNASWSSRSDIDVQREDYSGRTGFYAAGALLIWWAMTLRFGWGEPWLPAALCGEAVILTMGFSALRTREGVLFSQFFLMTSQFVWLIDSLSTQERLPWWSGASVVAASFILSRWWQFQESFRRKEPLMFQAYFAAGLATVLFFWMRGTVSPAGWLLLVGMLGAALSCYGSWAKSWFILGAGQIFFLATTVEYLRQLNGASFGIAVPPWYCGIVPPVIFFAFALMVTRLVRRIGDNETWLRNSDQLPRFYQITGAGLSLVWVFRYIPDREQFWFLTLAAILVFGIGWWKQNRAALGFAAVYAVCGLAVFWLRTFEERTVYLPNLMAILALFVVQQAARRSKRAIVLNEQWHAAAAFMAAASLWLFSTRWVALAEKPIYLSVAWAVLGAILLGAGLVLRERFYRWSALGILSLALARVGLLDIWRLELIYRVISLTGLGIVLVLLGFVYNRYQEKFKEWL